MLPVVAWLPWSVFLAYLIVSRHWRGRGVLCMISTAPSVPLVSTVQSSKKVVIGAKACNGVGSHRSISCQVSDSMYAPRRSGSYIRSWWLRSRARRSSPGSAGCIDRFRSRFWPRGRFSPGVNRRSAARASDPRSRSFSVSSPGVSAPAERGRDCLSVRARERRADPRRSWTHSSVVAKSARSRPRIPADSPFVRSPDRRGVRDFPFVRMSLRDSIVSPRTKRLSPSQ